MPMEFDIHVGTSPFDKYPQLRALDPDHMEFEAHCRSVLANDPMVTLYIVLDAQTGEVMGLIGSKIVDWDKPEPQAELLLHSLFEKYGTDDNILNSFHQMLAHLRYKNPDVLAMMEYVPLHDQEAAAGMIAYLEMLGFEPSGKPAPMPVKNDQDEEAIEVCQAMRLNLKHEKMH